MTQSVLKICSELCGGGSGGRGIGVAGVVREVTHPLFQNRKVIFIQVWGSGELVLVLILSSGPQTALSLPEKSHS